nr:hypothetical protein [Candidatus Sigynarchaeum springense]
MTIATRASGSGLASNSACMESRSCLTMALSTLKPLPQEMSKAISSRSEGLMH